MNNGKTLYVAWRNPHKRSWYVVGQLSEEAGVYTFQYTQGAKTAHQFDPFIGMDDLTRRYRSRQLFPVFQNRVLSEKRAEYPQFIRWLGLDEEQAKHPLNMLARSGGRRVTDHLQMFAMPQFDAQGRFELYFFLHGLAYRGEEVLKRARGMQMGDRLTLRAEEENLHDKQALAIYAEQPEQCLGYCPRFLTDLMGAALQSPLEPLRVEVAQISEDAPLNYFLMCKASGRLRDDQVRELVCNPEFQLLAQDTH